jgi:hypothetical protein
LIQVVDNQAAKLLQNHPGLKYHIAKLFSCLKVYIAVQLRIGNAKAYWDTAISWMIQLVKWPILQES